MASLNGGSLPPGMTPPPGLPPAGLTPPHPTAIVAVQRSRSRSHSRRHRHRDGHNRDGHKKKRRKDNHPKDRHQPGAGQIQPFHTGVGPPPMWMPPYGYPGYGPQGYMPPHGSMPYGMPHPGMHGASPRSSMADDGVSMQVSEKFLMRNDYSQTFIDSGLRPQNFIRDLDYPNRYSEYPKIERLITLKDDILAKRATPAMSLKVDLKEHDLTALGTKFDVILVDPPWEEYKQRVCGIGVLGEDLEPWTLEELKQLKVGEIADSQSFLFMWVGETHLENARELFKRWGFRRVEDIVWVKTNRKAEVDAGGRVKQGNVMYGDASIVQRTKEHCLVGVKGTLKRSEDTHFIHANCDTDLIMQEEEEFGSTHKPRELYETIEHFCLGRRRLELFGVDRNMRDGWLTLGNGLTFSNWNKDTYLSWFDGDGDYPGVQNHIGGRLLGSIPEIDALRPKSPERDRGRDRDRGRAGGIHNASKRTKEMNEEDRPLPEDLGEKASRAEVLGQEEVKR